MTRMRSLVASISPAGLMIPLALTALLGWQAISGITMGLDQAKLCADDWQTAIEAMEGGATEFNGRCLSVGGLGPDGEVPEDFYVQRDLAFADLAAAAERLKADPWGNIAGNVGGLPLIFLALFGGAMAAGSPMASAVTAWGLSNGWTRPVWARSVMGLTVGAVLVAYVLAVAGGVAYLATRMQAAEVALGWQIPGGSAFAPLAGILFYASVGVLAGAITGRGEIGGMLAVVLSIADFIASAQFGQPPFLPSTWHQSLVGNGVDLMSMPVAALVASSAAVLLGILAYRYMTGHRDVPDR